MNTPQRQACWLLFLISLVSTFGGVLVQEVHHTAVFYAAMSRQMVETGDFLAPFRGEAAYLLKPPLALWWSALNSLVLGFNNFAVTLPSRLGGLGCVLMTWVLARRFFGSLTAAWVAAFVFVTNSLYVHFTTAFRLDSLMTLGALMILWGYLELSRERGAVVFCTGLALSVFTKGPMILTMLLVLLPHAAASGQWRHVSPRFWRWTWVLLLPAVWFAWVWYSQGDQLSAQLNDDFWRGSSSNAQLSAAESALLEYAIKPAKRLWPWLPLFLAALAWAIQGCARRGWSRQQRLDVLLLLALFLLNYGVAWVKPDPDVRYLYASLPLVAVLAGGLVARMVGPALPCWTRPLAAITLLGAIGFAVQYNREGFDNYRDLRAMQAMVTAGTLNAGNTVALVGSIPPADAPRRNDPVPDWIYFYLGLQPQRLRYAEAPRLPSTVRYVLLSRNDGREARLEQLGMQRRLVTVKMVLFERP